MTPAEAEKPSNLIITTLPQVTTGSAVLLNEGSAGTPVEGATYGIYSTAEIKNFKGEVLIPANTLIEAEKTDANGEITFEADLPLGRYYIKEDPTSIIDQITDISGKTWDYKNTYILTEYAWRNHANDNYMHVSDTFTKKISGEFQRKSV